MSLDQLYKHVAADSHAAALQAVYNAGYSDGVKAATPELAAEPVNPLTDLPTITTLEVPANDNPTPSP